MDTVTYFVGRFFAELKPLLEWALRNWVITAVAVLAFIYWAGRHSRLNRHHL